MTRRLRTLADHRAAYADGASVAEVVADLRRRMAELADDAIFIGGLAPGLDQWAAALDVRSDRRHLPLFGIPVAVKDNIDVAGLPTTVACPDFATTPEHSATVVERLLQAGALVVGKANLDQFATGLVGTRSPYGAPSNVLDPAVVPGGSSSGSAVAVAAGLVPVALGTDTAGSGRVPAAMNQIVGLKPTRGLVSSNGVFPACRSLDCVSVFSHTIGDSAELYNLLAGEDGDDPWARVDRDERPPLRLDRTVVGVPPPEALEGVDLLILASWERMVAAMADGGAEVVEVDTAPFLEAGTLLYEGPFLAERYASIRDFLDRSPESVEDVTRRVIADGARWSAAEHHLARCRIRELRAANREVWARVDALALPTVPHAPTVDAVAREPLATNAELGRFTAFTNLLDLAAVTLPDHDARRPGMGITLHAPARSDARLLRWAATLIGEPPPGQTGSGVEVVVVGAHLEGQPRNRRLAALGAALVEQTTTASTYRLWALPDGERPALERVSNGGVAIDVEVWALEQRALGSLVAALGPPLAIGTVELVDGRALRGFVVEAGGLAGATDITAYGGWRAWLAR